MWVTENEIPEGSLNVKSARFPEHEQPYPLFSRILFILSVDCYGICGLSLLR